MRGSDGDRLDAQRSIAEAKHVCHVVKFPRIQGFLGFSAGVPLGVLAK